MGECMRFIIAGWFLVVAALNATRVDAADQPGIVSSEFIFTEAPHPQCHASTIVETPSGLVAAWFGGTRERDPDVGIWVSRQIDGEWSPQVEVANGIQYTRPDGTVHRHAVLEPGVVSASQRTAAACSTSAGRRRMHGGGC